MPALGELAERVGARVDQRLKRQSVTSLALPQFATGRELSLAVPGVMNEMVVADSSAAAVMLCGTTQHPRAFRVDNVVTACARIIAWLPARRSRATSAAAGTGAPIPPTSAAQIHPSAVVARGAEIGANASIGEGTVVEAGAIIGAGVSIGDYCRVGARCVITGYARVGNRCTLGPAVTIGGDGFAFVRDGVAWLKLPSFGSVSLGDDVFIGAQAVIHCGVFTDTVISSGCVLDSHVLIGHDCRVGSATAIAGGTALAGAVRIGRGCRIGGQCGLAEGVAIADGVTVTGMSMVTQSLDCPDTRYSSGWPAERSRRWWQRVAKLKRNS